MLFRWQLGRRSDPAADSAAAGLSRELKLTPLVARLLCQRGFHDPARVRPFLDPKLTDLHDPSLMPGIDRAARRLDQAVRQKQPIVVYGDYDVDGVCASAILWHVLKLAGATVTTYIPHRVDEGYGLNTDALLQLGKNGGGPAPLIISVDCGITAIEPAEAAAAAGIELIITDHHEFDPARLPRAYALVHPRLQKGLGNEGLGPGAEGQGAEVSPPPHPHAPSPSHSYPFPDLCGAGVAFKLAWHFARIHTGSDRVPKEFRELLLDLISYAALATVADIVPLVSENRVLVRYGLGQVKRTRFIGLNALIDSAKLREEKIDAFHVGFVLGPRLNAAGRMGHASEALKLLTSAGPDEAKQLAAALTDANDERRTTEHQIADEAKRMVRDLGFDRPDCRALVLGSEGWHPGVIGIVASRIVEQFHRPTILLNFENGEAHGSCRSIPGISIHEGLHACARHLNSYGGHAMAAGVRLDRDKVEAFRNDFIAWANEKIAEADLSPVLMIDADCALPEVTLEMIDQVQALAPFGRDNPPPVLCVRNVQLAEPARRIGGEGKHLRLMLRHERMLVQAVGWRIGDLAEKLPGGARVDVAFEPKASTWEGRRRADLHVKDVRLTQNV